MNDRPAGPSGSRWEPEATQHDSSPVEPTAPQTAPQTTAQPVPPDDDEPGRRSRLRTRLRVLGGALGLIATAGAGGFVVGHAVAANDESAVVRQGSVPGQEEGPARPDGEWAEPPDTDGDGQPDLPERAPVPGGPGDLGEGGSDGAAPEGIDPDDQVGPPDGDADSAT